MSDDLDGYEPAIEPTSHNAEASVESQPAGKGAAAAAEASARAEAAGEAPGEKIGTPPGEDDGAAGPEPGPRRQRVWSGKSRALFQQLAAKGGVGADMPDDLVPMEHQPAPAAAPVAAAPQPSDPAAAPAPKPDAKPPVAAPPAAPVTPPPGLPDLPDLPLPAETATPAAAPAPDPKHAEREQALAAREAALAERERLLPDRRALIERPGEAVIAWLADTYGITDPGELKTAVADLITEMSATPKGLGIGVPDEHMAGAASRRATRVVATYTRDVDKRERQLKEREAEAEKKTAAERAKQQAEQQETAYIAQIGERLGAVKDRLPFLHDAELTDAEPARVVYEVMKEQRKQASEWAAANPGKAVPQQLLPNLATATQFAEKYYRDKAEAITKRAARFQSLLVPAAPAAAQPAAKPAAPSPAASASPGGAPGPAPTPAAKPEPKQPARDPSDLPDKGSARAATFAKLRQRAGEQPNT